MSNLRAGKQKLTEDTARVMRSERQFQKGATTLEGGWTIFDSGAYGKDGYYENNRDGQTFEQLLPLAEVKADIAQREAVGQKVMVLDVMGQGRIGVDLGATKSVGWTYQKQRLARLKGRSVEFGDLLKQSVVDKHIKKLAKDMKRNLLTDVYFRPAGGAGVYAWNTYASTLLYENLFRPLYNVAPVGTRFHLGMTWAASASHGLLQALKSEGYDLREAKIPLYLLTKTGEKSELPLLRTLAKKYDLEQYYPEGGFAE